MLGRIEPMSENGVSAPPEPTLSLPLIPTSTPIDRSRAHMSIQTSSQNISPGNAPRPLILRLKFTAGAQFQTEPGNGAEYGARKYDMVMP
ncbi:hypothetical protein [Absidia glauca]|uniref:Uncharacterized protein n=1 Tax=Absidia glauca TaxID=4829 RepID=A0A163MLU9_ABSGL|nr:hypothetical protein [Absidia glauca]